MGELNLKRCPICDGDLDFGTVRFPLKNSFMELHSTFVSTKGKAESEENNKGNPLKKIFDTSYVKKFYIADIFGENPAGCCAKCGKIYAEFDLPLKYVDHSDDDYEYTEECETECAEDSVPLIWNSFKGEFVSKNDFSENFDSENYNGGYEREDEE